MFKNLIEKLDSNFYSGFLLLFFACCAMFMENSDFFSYYYNSIVYSPIYIKNNSIFSYITVQSIVNNFLMSLFFLIVAIEIKYETLYGNLNGLKQLLFPLIAALGGITLPIFIYNLFNFNEPIFRKGWGIPVATDIVFLNSILMLLGNRIPNNIRIFLLSLAVIDDLGALTIVTLFYNNSINLIFLLISIFIILLIILINIYEINKLNYYLILGILLWFFIFFSGLHVTVSGIIFAILIPFDKSNNIKLSPAFIIEKKLKPFVTYLVLPMFAFVNSGIPLHGIIFGNVISNLSFGIVLGFLIGKPLGIMLFVMFAIKLKLIKFPNNVNLIQISAVSFLCSVGFTMSIFIANLAFPKNCTLILDLAKLSIFISSIITLITSYFLLRKVFPKKN